MRYLIIMILVVTALAFGIAVATITVLNQLFGLEIPHSLVSYVNILFLMLITRFVVTPNLESKKMQRKE